MYFEALFPSYVGNYQWNNTLGVYGWQVEFIIPFGFSAGNYELRFNESCYGNGSMSGNESGSIESGSIDDSSLNNSEDLDLISYVHGIMFSNQLKNQKLPFINPEDMIKDFNEFKENLYWFNRTIS